MAELGSDDNDASLATRFRDGDAEAVTEVYRRYSGPMYAVARWMLRDPTLAADMVQQAFLQAWRSAGSFDPSRRLAPWLYQITRRVCVDTIRRERRRPITAELADDTVLGAVDDTESIERSWAAWQVREAIERLPARERAVARLAHVDGLTHREIAVRLDVPIGTVKSRMSRAQERLAEALVGLAPPGYRDPAGRDSERGAPRSRTSRRPCREVMSSLR
jgi:RNA polymerase sigma-70 factor (ECF subfamily)